MIFFYIIFCGKIQGCKQFHIHFPSFFSSNPQSNIVIMLPKLAYKKLARNTLQQPAFYHHFTSAPHQDLIKQINAFVSSSFSFGIDPQILKQLKTCLVSSALPRDKIIILWNQSLNNQLWKIRVSLRALHQKTSVPASKLQKQAAAKIDKCSSAIARVLGEVGQEMNWCKCQRLNCGSRIIDKELSVKIHQFIFQQTFETKPKQAIVFVPHEMDQICEKITLNKLYGVQSQELSVIEFLKSMKVGNQRIKCDCSLEWLEEIQKKY